MDPCDQPGSDWAVFYLTHRQGLAAYARSLSHDAADAQDLIQDVLVRMVREGRSTQGARPFVFRAMRNLAIDRQRRRRIEADSLPRVRTRLELSATIVDASLLDSLHEALESLNDSRREVIVLRIYAGLTFEEIAEATARPVGTIASQYARGIDALRVALNPERKHVRTRC